MIAVGDIASVRHALYDAETLLEAFGKLIGGAPVSYTHLDVYKRQDSGRIQVAVTVYRVNGSLHGIQRGYIQLQYRLRRNAHKGNLSGPLNPVSYTHLDVYKRQGQHGQ